MFDTVKLSLLQQMLNMIFVIHKMIYRIIMKLYLIQFLKTSRYWYMNIHL